MPEYLNIFLISMSPIVELRGSIPLALSVYKMDPSESFLVSVIGNSIPPIFILLFLDNIYNLIKRIGWLNKIFIWLFERTRKSHSEKFERFKEFALMLLVAIPLPLTGVWTGSLCAFLFGIPFKKAYPLIFTGVLISGTIVTFLTIGIINIT